MLHNVQAALAQERGFSMRAMTNPNGPEGNVVVRLFIDALTLQPCNPTCMFLLLVCRHAFNYMLSYGCARCLDSSTKLGFRVSTDALYSAFVSLGLGSNAKDDFVDESVPPDCFR